MSYRDENNQDPKLLECDDPDRLIGGDVIVSLDADCAETVGGVAELAGPLDSSEATSWMPQVVAGVILLVLAISGGLLALRPARRR